jgi:hypothetical protein
VCTKHACSGAAIPIFFLKILVSIAARTSHQHVSAAAHIHKKKATIVWSLKLLVYEALRC